MTSPVVCVPPSQEQVSSSSTKHTDINRVVNSKKLNAPGILLVVKRRRAGSSAGQAKRVLPSVKRFERLELLETGWNSFNLPRWQRTRGVEFFEKLDGLLIARQLL